MKLLLANLFVASVIALALVGFAKADGVDDPNYYQDFDYCFESSMQNQSQFCRKYDNIGKPDWSHDRKRFVSIPDDSEYIKPVKTVSVDEPNPSLMLIAGTVMVVIAKKIRGEI